MPNESVEVPEPSELGKHWMAWFEAVGEHANVDVVNATTKLVLAEREVRARSQGEIRRQALEGGLLLCVSDGNGGGTVEIRFSDLRKAQDLHRALASSAIPAAAHVVVESSSGNYYFCRKGKKYAHDPCSYRCLGCDAFLWEPGTRIGLGDSDSPPASSAPKEEKGPSASVHFVDHATFQTGCFYCEERRRAVSSAPVSEQGEPFLSQLRRISVLRAREDFKTYENAGLLYFTTALAGEVGELCNLVKKLERAKCGGPDHGNTTKLADITPEKLRDEVAGIFIYLDLLASLLDVDMEAATVETFNNVSEKIGSSYRLAATPPSPEGEK